MKRRSVRFLVLIGLVAALAACAPSFPDGSEVWATALGPLVLIEWDEAIEEDDGQTVDRYRIDVNGAEVGSIDAPATSCVLTGLSAGLNYKVSVTAYDSADEWSGNRSNGRLTTEYTAPTTGGAGRTRRCVSATDTDGDRLPDALESNTGRFVDASSPGTDPARSDTDGDGISDGDETLGTSDGLNLRALGAAPVRKDLLFEFDWFDDNIEPGVCASHSHRPTPAAITRMTTAFAASPVTNPDGTTGVNVISDYGQGGVFSGGNVVPDSDGVIAGGVNGPDFASIKNGNLAVNRRSLFHYVLMPHRYDMTSGSSGQAELPGNDLVVSLYCFGTDSNVANTIMHEVGHNFGLRHGGNVNAPNHKPNYNSVMNYRYQFPGVDTDCLLGGDGALNYSVGTRAPLDEAALNEAQGICNNVAIDWNINGAIDPGPVSAELTSDTSFSVLRDNNDWASLNFAQVTEGDGASVQSEIVTEQPVPLVAR